MKKRYWFYLVMIISQNVLSQSGYLGNKNGAEIRFDFNPSLKRCYRVSDDAVISKPRFACTKISLNYSRIITRHAEISVGYEYTGIQADMTYLYLNTTTYNYELRNLLYSSSNGYTNNKDGLWLIDNTRFTHNALNFEYNYFRKLALSPVGSFVGFALSAGQCNIAKGKEVVYGDMGNEIRGGVLRNKNEIVEINSYKITESLKFKTFHFSLHAGQNIPISKRFLFTIKLSIPFFYWSGASISKNRVITNFMYYDFDQYYRNPIQSVDLTDVLRYSYGLYNRLSVDVGLRIMF